LIPKTKSLLLDLNPKGGLGDTLQVVLEESINRDIQICHESTRELPLYSQIQKTIYEFKPNVIFLIIAPIYFEQTREFLQALDKEELHVPIILVSEGCCPDEMFTLLKMGAADFITPPLTALDILPRIWRLLDQTHLSKTLTYKLKKKLGLQQLIGESSAFLAVINKIPLVAKCDASVLITGETGTGKELCARAIHYLSQRADKPFVPVTCGAIPTDLMENELFGHLRGAFTGASSSHTGLIHEADGGTLFLDDIDCLPLPAQVKLLRLLQEKEYRQLGSTKTHQANVRIIAATNIMLEEAARKGDFRQDLFYRLNIIPLTLPPLRDRREDIPLLARYFLQKYAAEFNEPVTGFAEEAMQILVLYDWPGNVRELEYVIERATVFTVKTTIHGVDLDIPQQNNTVPQEPFREVKAKVIDQFERDYIHSLLLTYQGNISRAAQAAQKNRRAFWQLIRKHQIDAQSFKPG
jgi:two-component system response regulator GlrR